MYTTPAVTGQTCGILTHQQIYKSLVSFWALFIAFELAHQSTRLNKSQKLKRETSHCIKIRLLAI